MLGRFFFRQFAIFGVIFIFLILDGCGSSSKTCGVCVPGAKRCSLGKTAVETCKLSATTHCWEWKAKSCNWGEVCRDDLPIPACDKSALCTNDCILDQFQCQQNTLMKCTTDEQGCTSWHSVMTCQADEICNATTQRCEKQNCQPNQPHSVKKCVGSSVYWFDDCGQQNDKVMDCQPSQQCQKGSCLSQGCQPKNPQHERRCVGNQIYWFDDCGNQGSFITTCLAPQKCAKGACTCTPTNPEAIRKCVGNEVHWFDDCGKKGRQIEICQPPKQCLSGQCSCRVTTTEYEKRCVGNSVYWFDNCGRQGKLVLTCAAGQACQKGRCQLNCQPNHHQKCLGNAIYWFDSCDNLGNLIKTCSVDEVCQNAQCVKSNACQGQNLCTPGLTQCFGRLAVQSCVKDPQTHCYVWGSVTACQSGQICKSGVCQTDNAQHCHVHSNSGVCSSNAECCSGQRCRSYLGINLCASCQTDADCPTIPSGARLHCCRMLGARFCAITCF